MARRRQLSEADLDLWRRVTDTAVPLHPDRGAPPSRPIAEETPLRASPAERRGGGEQGLPPPRRAPPPGPALDARRMERLRRGAMRPEARIDLHGMTLDQAKPALIGFVMRVDGEGKRIVLVITGKGGAQGRGALRRQVPHWLTMTPLSPLVLEAVPAHRRHGGDGALYVYLRRRR